MAVTASPPPSRFLSGFTQDAPYQPLHNMGVPDPFFYHMVADDFDLSAKTPANFYVTATSGTAAAIAGATGTGGIMRLTSGSAAGWTQLQQAFSNFKINIQPKKCFFMTSIKPSGGATGLTGYFGFMSNQNAAPNDGVYFQVNMLTGGIQLVATSGGVQQGAVTIPAVYSYGAFVTVYLAFQITRTGDVIAYVSNNPMVGYNPQSNLDPTLAIGPVARLTGIAAFTAADVQPALSLIQAGTASINVDSDYILGAAER